MGQSSIRTCFLCKFVERDEFTLVSSQNVEKPTVESDLRTAIDTLAISRKELGQTTTKSTPGKETEYKDIQPGSLLEYRPDCKRFQSQGDEWCTFKAAS